MIKYYDPNMCNAIHTVRITPSKYAGWCDTSCPEGIAVCCRDCSKKDKCNLDDKCKDSNARCPRYVVNPNH